MSNRMIHKVEERKTESNAGFSITGLDVITSVTLIIATVITISIVIVNRLKLATLFEKLYEYIYPFFVFIYRLCGVDMASVGGNRPIQLEDIFHVALADIAIVGLTGLICVGVFAILKILDKKTTAMLNKIVEMDNKD